MQMVYVYNAQWLRFFRASRQRRGMTVMAKHPLDDLEQVVPDLSPWSDVDVSEDNEEIAYPEKVEEVDVRNTPKDEEFEKPWRAEKEKSAGRIAILLLRIFGGFLGLYFLGGLTLLLIAAVRLPPASSAELTQKHLIPLLTSIGDVSLKLFSPLLAFVLGYYFGKKE
jgi:hypothetical protein